MENYFNYFTEIEEQFRKFRSEPVRLSPLDWALIESWKEMGFPLEAVLTGIEHSFAKFKPGRRTYRKVNSLAYCSQEVLRAVEETRTAAAQGGGRPRAPSPVEAPFAREDLSRFLVRSAGALEDASRRARAEGLTVLADDLASATAALGEFNAALPLFPVSDLEGLERNLTALEEKVHASLLRAAPVEVMVQLRAEVERSLVPYRRRMAAVEVESLERRFLKNRLFEQWRIPRLSLFYL